MRRPVLFALVLCCLVVVYGLNAALSAAAQQKPTFRAGVEVVLLDVNVVDASHTPIENLTPEDFVVSVDYKPRKVVSAEFVRYDVRTTTVTERRTEPGVRSTRVATPPAARNVLIAIDTDSMEPGDGMLARQEAAKFLDKLAPDDRVGVVMIPRMQSVVTMTKIRAEARAELAKVITGSERYRPLQFNIGMAEAFDVERGDGAVAQSIILRECGPRPLPGCPDEVRMEIRQVQLEAHMRGLRSFEALRDLGRAVSGIEGPKTVLYLTGGAPPADLKSAAAYSEVGSAFAAAQITLYTLYIHQELLHQAKGRPSPTALRDMDFEREGVENATGAANGTLMEVVGTFDRYFERIVTELSGSYLIGIEVQAADRDGKPHQVSVKVNRKGLDVRARKQYLIEPATTPRSGGAISAGARATARPPAPATKANAARALAATPADLQPLVERMGQYVGSYEQAFLALLSEERAEFKLAKWALQGTTGAWTVASQRRLAAENLLVKRPGAAGWTALRDVFEVDGQPIRPRDGRLRAMFLDDPDTIIDRASALTTAAVAHEIGFVNRGANATTSALVFLRDEHRGRFVFAQQGEQLVAGIKATEIAFDERGDPAFIDGQSGRVPVSGTLWADPSDGTIVKTLVRWEADGTTAEIAVTYARATDGALWAPSEMRESYTLGSERLECVTRFSNYRKYVASVQ